MLHAKLILTIGLVGSASPAFSQESGGAIVNGGTITGLVVDAATGGPIPGASIDLIADADSTNSSVLLSTATDWSGRYRLHNVPLGPCVIRVRRLGYHPTKVRIRLGQHTPFRVSVAMEVLPIVLDPEHVTAHQQTFGRGDRDRTNGRGRDIYGRNTARVVAHEAQNRAFLQSDARILTHLDLVDATTFGEADLFRAMQYLPGVASRDDYTAELWTRGAPWSHTRVSFDGMPLYNPLHTSGVFSAINPDALGSVAFLPGGRSAQIGEGAAGVVQLESRRASDTAWSGTASISAVSAGVSLGHRFEGGRGGIMAAARRSYVDLVMGTVADITNDPDARFPYAFADAAARIEIPVGEIATLDMSGLFEQDQLRGDVRNIIRDSQGTWGNMTGRVSLTLPFLGLSTKHTLGGTRFRGAMRIGNPFFEFIDSVPAHSRMDNRIDYAQWETLVRPIASSERIDWTAGVQLIAERQLYDGPFPRPYPSHVVFDSLQITEARFTRTLWGDLRVRLTTGMEADFGLRIEIGDSLLEQSNTAFHPRVAWRFTPAANTTVSLSYARSFQYSQAVAPAGPGIGPQLHLTDVWLLAGTNAPPINADILTFGAARWFGDSWLANLTLYARTAEGVAVPDPSPGVYKTVRPVFVSGVNRARGLEASARKITGRWNSSVAVAVSSSRMTSRSTISGSLFEYPAESDRRLVMSATAAFQATRALRIGGAASIATGSPFTRFVLQTLPCDSLAGTCPPPAGALTIEEPNANRSPAFASASVMAEWTKAFDTWELAVYLRVRNISSRRNAVTYAGSIGGCTVAPEDGVVVATRVGVCDLFDRGLPLLPLAGVSIAF